MCVCLSVCVSYFANLENTSLAEIDDNRNLLQSLAIARVVCLATDGYMRLSTFSTDTSGELDVFGHDGGKLDVDGAQVGFLDESDKVGFVSFLESHDDGALETKIGLEVWAISCTNLWNGSLRIRSTVLFWLRWISSRAMVPGLYLCGFYTRAGSRRALAGGLGS